MLAESTQPGFSAVLPSSHVVLQSSEGLSGKRTSEKTLDEFVLSLAFTPLHLEVPHREESFDEQGETVLGVCIKQLLGNDCVAHEGIIGVPLDS